MTPSSPPLPFKPSTLNWLDHTKLFTDMRPFVLCRRATAKNEPTASANGSEVIAVHVELNTYNDVPYLSTSDLV